MVVRNISRNGFDQLFRSHLFLDRFIGTETEWFAADTGKVIGVIASGQGNHRWNSAVYSRGQAGAIQTGNLSWVSLGLQDAPTTRVRLLLAMAAAERFERRRRSSKKV